MNGTCSSSGTEILEATFLPYSVSDTLAFSGVAKNRETTANFQWFVRLRFTDAVVKSPQSKCARVRVRLTISSFKSRSRMKEVVYYSLFLRACLSRTR